jgi:hypothetical protein
MAFLGMALLVALTGFPARAYTVDVQQVASVDQQECTSDGGWFDQDISVCEYEAP